MFSRLLARWRGVAISLIGVIATLWLAASGQLGLYIHPRYFEFTVVMTVIAGVAVMAACALLPLHQEAGDHEHDPDPAVRPRRVRRVLGTAASAAAILGIAALLLMVPPSSLSSSGITQDSLNSAPVLTSDDVTPQLNAGDGSQFTVKDWATLLRQGADETVLAGKRVDVSGFVTPDPTDPDNVFYVTRYSITCCAVDAQPLGIPVYQAGWRSTLAKDQWVHVTGGFRPDPRGSSSQPYVIRADAIAAIDEPSDPYVY